VNGWLFDLINGLAGRSDVFDAFGRFCAGPLVWILGFGGLAVAVAGIRSRPAHSLQAIAVGLLAYWLGHEISSRVKEWTEVARPFDARSGVHLLVDRPPTFSFPSGHAVSAGALAMSVALAYPRLAPYWLPAAVLVAFGRVFVGVHYPLDVAAGLVIGSGLAVMLHLGLSRIATKYRV
jgi:undecaprenyl-diphosphatase